MSTFVKIYGDAADVLVLGFSGTTYATAREVPDTIQPATNATDNVGQDQSGTGTNWFCGEGLLGFTTTSIASYAVSSVTLGIADLGTNGTSGRPIEVREKNWTYGGTLAANFTAGSALGALVPFGSPFTPADAPGVVTYYNIRADKSGVLANPYKLIIFGSDQRTNTPPVTSEYFTLLFADATGTSEDPFIMVELQVPSPPRESWNHALSARRDRNAHHVARDRS